MKPLLSAQEIETGIARLATEIRGHYGDRALTIVGILTGSLVVLADLIRHLDLPLKVGVVQARSYRGQATRPGELQTSPDDWLPDVAGRHVLLLDDIFDTGHTLARLIRQFQSLEPASLKTAVLLRKSGRQEVEVVPDFVAFEIPNKFVVGYGLDYNDLYRNLPYLAALDEHDTAEPKS